jgi:uncharacterized protein (TIGR03437 family)
LTLSGAGVLSGTPTTLGTYSFTVQVADRAGATASNLFQLVIAPPALVISTTSLLPAGKVNTGYSTSLGATGGIPPYTNWTISNGTLPQGLTLSSAGVLSGTPTTAGAYSFTIQLTDSAGGTASAPFQLNIVAGLAITNGSPLPDGKVNTAYSLSLTASGGTPPYSNWTISSGTLPPGLTLSSAGVLSGTATTAGICSFTVQASDSAGAFASVPFQLTITLPSPSILAAVSSANFVAGLPVTSGSWVALYGTNLAPEGRARLWNPTTEIINGKLPASLDGTSVTVNGKSATVEYISPGQVNIQMPDDATVGPVPVVVTTTSGGASNSFMVTYAQFSPGFFPATAPYVVAQHADSSYVTANAPALPGEVIVLWGGAMGPASPAVPAAQVFSGANPLAYTVTLTIGGQPAMLDFAGVVGTGLVQINAHVPVGIGAGDQAIVATVGGVSSPAGAYISIGAPSVVSSQLPPLLASPNFESPTVNGASPAVVLPTPIYAGTDSGIYKSTDGGASWQPSLPAPGQTSSINSIVVDPLHPARVYAAGVNGSGGDTFFASLDAGSTWSTASAPPAAALALDGTSPNMMYLLEANGGRVYKSEDSGQTWIPTQLENITAIAADPNMAGVVYASKSLGPDGLLKSYDFGTTWTAVATSLNVEVSALAIDSHSSYTLYAAVIPLGVLRSIDSGNTWQDLSHESLTPFAVYPIDSSDGGATTAVAAVFTDPVNDSYLYLLPKLPSNGLFRSTNGGVSWIFSPVVSGGDRVISLGMLAK